MFDHLKQLFVRNFGDLNRKSNSLSTTYDLLTFFHISGNIIFNDFSNIIFKNIVTDSLQIFMILIDILSYPHDLFESNDFFIDNISFFITQKEYTLVLV